MVRPTAGVDASTDVAAWHRDATALLASGLPFDLTDRAAADFAEQAGGLLAAPMAGDDALLLARLLTGHALAATQLADDAGVASVEAVEQLAADTEDELVGAYASVARAVVSPTPEHTEVRLAAGELALEVAERHGDAALLPIGCHLLMVALLEKGQIHSLDAVILEQQQAAVGLPRPHHADPVGRFRVLRSILDGDADLAEKQATELYLRSDREGSNAHLLYTTQLGIIAWMRGETEGAEDGFLAARREYPDQLLWPASLAWLWIGQGRRAAADALLRSFPDLDQMRRDRYWLSTMTVLAEIATEHGPRERAEQLRNLLLPFADHLVTVGHGVAFWGTAARTLGLLEERLGLLDDARQHLETAIEIAGRVGALAWLAEAQIELAEFAIRHDLADVPAYELLSEARATAEAGGFAGLAARAVHPARIRVFGRFEVVSTNGQVAPWTSRKARELLKMLVAQRGVATPREVFMEQLWPEHDPAQLANRFAVAVNTVRRALDPEKRYPRQHHVVVDGEAIRLELEHLDVDLERFHALVRRGDEQGRLAAAELYERGVLPDEPYADWAIAVRDEVDHLWHRVRPEP